MVNTCYGVVVHCLRRRHWPPGNPDGRPGSLLWPRGILVCHTLPVPVFYSTLLKVLDHKGVPCRAGMPGIHDGKCFVSRDRHAPCSPSSRRIFRNGCPLSSASCFTLRSFFACGEISSRAPRESGPSDGSLVAKAGSLHSQEIILTRAPSRWPPSSCGTP